MKSGRPEVKKTENIFRRAKRSEVLLLHIFIPFLISFRFRYSADLCTNCQDYLSRKKHKTKTFSPISSNDL
jgi:hypothetical protein